MTDLLDLEHQRRSRAEHVVTMLRALWGDALPAEPHPELMVLIDAIAVDDDDAASHHVVSHGDGLTYAVLAALCHASPAAAHALLPVRLVIVLQQVGLLPPTHPRAPSDPVAGQSEPGADQPTRPQMPGQVPPPSTSAAFTSPTPASRAPAPADGEVGMWEVDPQTRTVAYDGVTAALMGQEPRAGHTSLDEHLNELIHPADRAGIEHAMQYALRTETTYRVRFRVLSATGTITWLISQGRVLRKPSDAGPRLTGYLITDPATVPSVHLAELS